MTDIMDLAKRRASARDAYLSASVRNLECVTPYDRIVRSEHYRLAQDAYFAAEREYRAAIDRISAEKLAELTREAS